MASNGVFSGDPAREQGGVIPGDPCRDDPAVLAAQESPVSLGPANDVKEQVRQAVDIVDLVESYLPLRRQGRQFVALCPWHADKRPSLTVNQERQSWRCWVCGDGGDVFSFVMKKENVDFREALEILAERARIELKPLHSKPAEPGSSDDKRTLYRAVQWAEQQFHEFLLRAREAESARNYLDQRGITAESLDRFRIGYAPPSWDWLLQRARSTPFSGPMLSAVGLVNFSEQSRRHYDFFRGRVIFPIRDTQRRPIAFGGRILPEIAKQEEAKRGNPPGKYINTPETRLFSKSEQLYGLDIVRDAVTRSRHIVIVEGYTDVVLPLQLGLDNFAAVCGTALGPKHIQLLKRYADRITLLLDGDEAGQRRSNEILELFVSEQVDLRVLTLPQELDPCDFIRERGVDAMRELLAGAVDALEHKFRVTTRGIDPSTDTHAANQAVEELLATLAKVPRMQTTSASLREQQFLTRIARQYQLREDDLRARMSELRRSAKPAATAQGGADDAPQARLREMIDPRNVELLEIMTLDGLLAAEAVAQIAAEHVAAGPARAIFNVYCRLAGSGEPLDFNRVLSELEDPRLKSLLVECDERAHDKEQHARVPAEQRLETLIEEFERGANERNQRAKLNALEQKKMDSNEENDFLRSFLAHEQQRHGISSPTDG
jgi:DNA primase